MEDTGVMCSTPLQEESHFSNPMNDDDYICPAESLPLDYPNWDEKWYSPLCRGWFQDQQASPYVSTMTDLYVYTDFETVGMTQCVPFLQDSDFKGSLCLDLMPEGNLNEYYSFH